MSIKHKLLLSLLFSAIGFVHAVTNNPVVGAVFTATELSPTDSEGNPQFNGVVMYHRHADGTLTVVPGSPFSTGGFGVGPGNFPPSDSLFSQDSIAVDENNKFLYVVNGGSDQISVFRIYHDKLKLIDVVSSGGSFPNSLAVRGCTLYALNSGDTTNVMGFKICKNGKLKPLKRCNLQPPLNVWPIIANGQPQGTAVPAQVSFSPNGRQLIVQRKEGFLCPDPNFPGFTCTQNVAGPGRMDVYALDKKHRIIDCANPTANINTRSPAGRMPFSFIFTENGQLISGEFLGTASSAITFVGASALSSYNLKSDGTLEIISADVPSGQTGVCWTARSGNFIYASNTASGTISLYEVDADGNLTLINAQAANLNTLTPSSPGALDTKTTSDGRFIYLLSPQVALIYAFAINQADGSLTFIGTASTLTPPDSGQMGLATSDFKN